MAALARIGPRDLWRRRDFVMRHDGRRGSVGGTWRQRRVRVALVQVVVFAVIDAWGRGSRGVVYGR